MIRIQTKIMLSTTEVECIALYQSMRYVLPSMILMKDIEFVIEIQGDDPEVLFSLFENPVTVHKDNQGEITLVVAPKMRPCTKNITIKYHHFQSFITNGDVLY